MGAHTVAFVIVMAFLSAATHVCKVFLTLLNAHSVISEICLASLGAETGEP